MKTLGEGNFTVVDLVISQSAKKAYAIKRSKEKLLKASDRCSLSLCLTRRHRFLREVQLFEEVRDCPHLVQYYKCWQEDGAALALSSPLAIMYILMECCARGNLTVSLSALSQTQTFLDRQSLVPESFVWVLLHTVLQVASSILCHPGAGVSARTQRGSPRLEARQPPLRRARTHSGRRSRVCRAFR